MHYIAIPILLLIAALTAGGADFRSDVAEVALVNASYGSVTISEPVGYVDEILFTVPAASATGTVSVIANRATPGIAGLTLASNIVTTAHAVRPGVDFTDATGGALASDPPRRPLLYGETVTVVVTNSSATNAVWQVRIKTATR